VDGELAAVDRSLVERAEDALGRVQVDELVWDIGGAAHEGARRLLVEAALAALDTDNDPVGGQPVRQQLVEHGVLCARQTHPHRPGERVEGLQVHEELFGVVGHLGCDLVELPRPQRVDRCRREPESLQGAADEVGHPLAFRREAIVFVGCHRHDVEALALQVPRPAREGGAGHAVAVENDGLACQPAHGHAVRPEHGVAEHRLVRRREEPVEHVAGMDLDGEDVDQRSRAARLREIGEVLDKRRLECGDGHAVEDHVGGERLAQRDRRETLSGGLLAQGGD